MTSLLQSAVTTSEHTHDKEYTAHEEPRFSKYWIKDSDSVFLYTCTLYIECTLLSCADTVLVEIFQGFIISRFLLVNATFVEYKDIGCSSHA